MAKSRFHTDKKIKSGFYTANYFLKTRSVLQKQKNKAISIIQFTHFHNESIKVCGIDECIDIIKSTTKKIRGKKIEVYGKKDGDIARKGEAVLIIKGQYKHFAFLENVIDGILARRSSVCNNCAQVLKHIDPRELIFMADRTDDYRMQPFDGYAAYVAGIRNFVTEASISLIKNKKDVWVTGTMPHALIQQNNGSLPETLAAYESVYGNSKTVALIDYTNDVCGEIDKIAKRFPKLWAVRVDTSENMIDKTIKEKYKKNAKLYSGVNHELIKIVRNKLDKVGLKNVKIIATSGLNLDKIKEFKDKKTPVDLYGIGSNLITRNVHFTADLVIKDNRPEAKAGRKASFEQSKLIKMKRYI